MNFRRYAEPRVLGFMIAPMIDILLVVLVFFIVTWNFALTENELDVRVPSAAKANEPQPYVGQVVINIRADGTIVVNRQPKTGPQLLQQLAMQPAKTPVAHDNHMIASPRRLRDIPSQPLDILTRMSPLT